MTLLCDLCVQYGTDKVIWGYTPHYFERLAPKRNRVKKVLEIGICGQRDIPNNVTGASLFVWQDFFPNAEIYGIDYDGKWMVNEGRIRSFQADAYDGAQLGAAINHFGIMPGELDFIVDDAVHDPDVQIKLLNNLWPFLAKDGLYAVEDVCPYKMTNGSLDPMIAAFPQGTTCDVISTHKSERLLLVEHEVNKT